MSLYNVYDHLKFGKNKVSWDIEGKKVSRYSLSVTPSKGPLNKLNKANAVKAVSAGKGKFKYLVWKTKVTT